MVFCYGSLNGLRHVLLNAPSQYLPVVSYQCSTARVNVKTFPSSLISSPPLPTCPSITSPIYLSSVCLSIYIYPLLSIY